MKMKAILFDMDGTLIDSLADIAGAVNRFLASQGFPQHSLADYKRFVGNGATKLMEQVLPEGHRTESQIQAGLAAFVQDYHENCVVESCLYPGIAELLDQLQSTDVKLTILSNKPHALTLQCADILLKAWNFDMILGQQDHIPQKPDPAGALHIAQELQVDPTECLFIGDSDVDMKTGLAAHMHPVGVTWGFRPEEQLRTCGAEYIVHKPDEILDLV